MAVLLPFKWPIEGSKCGGSSGPDEKTLGHFELLAGNVGVIGDWNPREHEISIQLRSYDVKGGRAIGVAALLALSCALIGRNLRGGLVVVGVLNFGGSIDVLSNAVDLVELSVEKGASVLLMPISAYRQLVDLSDEMATKVYVLLTCSPQIGPSGMRVILARLGRRTFDEAYPPLARADHPQAQ